LEKEVKQKEVKQKQRRKYMPPNRYTCNPRLESLTVTPSQTKKRVSGAIGTTEDDFGPVLQAWIWWSVKLD
jgi:hypothetical protein